MKQSNESQALNRYARYKSRRLGLANKKTISIKKPQNSIDEPLTCRQENHQLNDDDTTMCQEAVEDIITNFDKECQVFIYDENDFSQPISKDSSVCNKYVTNTIYNNTIIKSVCEAEIQTDIKGHYTLMNVCKNKKFKNKSCGTKKKTFVDTVVGPNEPESGVKKVRSFEGFSSIKNEEQLVELGGVTFENFYFLLRRTKTVAENEHNILAEDKLLIFVMKMKTGLTFSALSVIFNIHRTTVSKIFFSLLRQLANVTEAYVFWPDKDTVQGTMPECFKPEYNSTRVIIDCTEFRIEVPSNIDDRVYCYSNYKKGFTAKVLIGITPGGFICFKSKACGGRKSDSQITIDSGLIDLLEEDDLVLADKGFPEFKTTISDSGKKVLVIMPPFLEKNNAFSKKETEETYSIARVRIHVERTMQRLRTYNILDKIPQHLFSSIDKIIHMACVLVSLQSPIISNTNSLE